MGAGRLKELKINLEKGALPGSVGGNVGSDRLIKVGAKTVRFTAIEAHDACGTAVMHNRKKESRTFVMLFSSFSGKESNSKIGELVSSHNMVGNRRPDEKILGDGQFFVVHGNSYYVAIPLERSSRS